MLVMCERWVRDRTDCHSFSDHCSIYPSFCWAAQPGSRGPKPSVWRWLSLRHLVSNCNWNSNCDCNSNWTLPASNSEWLKLSVAPGYIIVCHPPASSHLPRIQPVHRSRWYSEIFDRMLLFLDWWLGRRSVCYIRSSFFLQRISFKYSMRLLRRSKIRDHIYPTPLLGQDMTQGQFFKRSLTGLNSKFSFS